MFGSDDLLAPISQLWFIPDDGLEEPLQRSGSDVLIATTPAALRAWTPPPRTAWRARRKMKT